MYKNMKALGFLFAIGLAACGGQIDPQDPQTSSTEQAATAACTATIKCKQGSHSCSASGPGSSCSDGNSCSDRTSTMILCCTKAGIALACNSDETGCTNQCVGNTPSTAY